MNPATFQTATRALLAVTLLALQACATSAQVKQPDEAASFVDQQMTQTLSSIDQSMKTLLVIDRGGESRGPSSSPLSSTVAAQDVVGASPQTPPIQPFSVTNRPRGSWSSLGPVAARSLPVESANTTRSVASIDSSRLSDRIRLDWKGSVLDLLQAMSTRIGYVFSETGSPRALPVVQVHRANATVSEVLSDLAHAINDQADIHINPSTKRIQLIYKQRVYKASESGVSTSAGESLQ